jgi:hypothetical protein
MVWYNLRMEKSETDKLREDKIIYEIVVDAYDDEERMVGWQTYLDDTLRFPFKAKCVKEIEISPLKKGELVTALKMADMDSYRNDIFVIIKCQNRQFGVPLEQIVPVDADEETLDAVENWRIGSKECETNLMTAAAGIERYLTEVI